MMRRRALGGSGSVNCDCSSESERGHVPDGDTTRRDAVVAEGLVHHSHDQRQVELRFVFETFNVPHALALFCGLPPPHLRSAALFSLSLCFVVIALFLRNASSAATARSDRHLLHFRPGAGRQTPIHRGGTMFHAGSFNIANDWLPS